MTDLIERAAVVGVLESAGKYESDKAVIDAIRALPAATAEKNGDCVWMQDSDGPWNTSCGVTWEFTDGGPSDNNTNFCHHCGGRILPMAHEDIPEVVGNPAVPDAEAIALHQTRPALIAGICAAAIRERKT